MNPVILFDGICNLCNSSVQFVIKRDTAKRFRFASLQSSYGKQFLEQNLLPGGDTFNSFILFENGTVFTRSTAALKVARKLNSGWRLLYILIFVPPFIRNAVYDLIARNRYRWFGKRDACWMPTPDLMERFFT